MASPDGTLDAHLEGYLRAVARRALLRLITCGSVDDGKSTLIGRLLYESKGIFEDHIRTLEADSQAIGTRDGGLDFALLLDGLSAEREQGITIDVAYRYFSTDKRTFVMADAPGHEQYTRNMVTGASTADLAVMLVDARKGVVTQTRRHTYLVSLLGIRRIMLAVNKMDLVAHAGEVFGRIERDYREFAARVGVSDITCIPISAVHGDNVVVHSGAMPWYTGPTVLQYLEEVPVASAAIAKPFRFLVQRINRANQDFRGAAGLIVKGAIRQGEAVVVMPSGARSRVERILIGDRDVQAAVADQAATLTLADDIDVSRGDVVADVDNPPGVADQFQATVIWMHERPMLPGRAYVMKIGTQTVSATVAPLKYKIDVNTLEHIAARHLDLNDVGVCNLELNRPIVFEPYDKGRDLGGFILIDRISNATVGAGLLQYDLRRSHHIPWQPFDIDKRARARLKGQNPCVLWFTGLSGAGKSTIANLVEKRLHALGHHTFLLDGDNVRHGLSKDLGFTDADRVENIRRVAEVARLMADAGLIVLVSFISPFRTERRMARELMEPGEFFEVFVDTPIAVAEARDPKGLYKKARRGELRNFTGVDSPYEVPETPDIRLDTIQMSAEQAAEAVLIQLRDASVIHAT